MAGKRKRKAAILIAQADETRLRAEGSDDSRAVILQPDISANSEVTSESQAIPPQTEDSASPEASNRSIESSIQLENLAPPEDDHKPTDFMDIPPELRNTIYELDIANYPTVRLEPKYKGVLLAQSPLARVSRQVRSEYNKMATALAPDMFATVKNFDFAHVVTCLNRLGDKELADLSTTTNAKAERTMTIKLVFDQNVSRYGLWWATGTNGLSRWLNRIIKRPGRKGGNIDFQYVARSYTYAMFSPGSYGDLLRGFNHYKKPDATDRRDILPKAAAIRDAILRH